MSELGVLEMPPQVDDQELAQRAVALGRLLVGVIHREAWDVAPKPLPPEELGWGASSLAARVLAEAIWLEPPLSKADAAHVVGERALEVLLATRLVRECLGTLELVSTSTVGRMEELERPHLDALALLRTECARPERQSLWISAERFAELLQSHRATFPRTPPDELLRVDWKPSTRGEVDGFRILVARFYATGWLWSARGVLGAKLWDLLAGDRDRDTAVLTDWMRRTAHVALDAPGLLERELRQRLLDAAMQLLLAEPSLGCPEEEFSAFRAELLGGTLTSDSAGASVFWWQRMGQVSHDGGLDETRGALMSLVSMVCHFDHAGLGVRPRVLELASLSSRKPYLAFLIQWQSRTCPQVIGSLLAHAPTASFGLMLLRGLHLQEATSWDAFESRDARLQAQRIRLLRDALPIFTKSVAIAASSGHLPVATRAIVDVLRWFAQDCVSSNLYDDGARNRAVTHAEEAFSVVSSHLTSAEPADHTPSSSLNQSPRLLALC